MTVWLNVDTALSSWAAVIGTGLGDSGGVDGEGVGDGVDAMSGTAFSGIEDRPKCTVEGLLVWGMVALQL
jgi:hypothetical protein